MIFINILRYLRKILQLMENYELGCCKIEDSEKQWDRKFKNEASSFISELVFLVASSEPVLVQVFTPCMVLLLCIWPYPVTCSE